MSAAGRAGLVVCVGIVALAALAPVVAPNSPDAQFADRAYAPPMRPHVRDARGWHRPFVYEEVLDDRLMSTYRRGAATPLAWLSDGHLVTLRDGSGPLLLLGGDALGRDVFSRLLFGARLSLGVAALGAAGALLIGALVGAAAGTLGGRTEGLLMLAADFVVVLPAVYLVLVLRAMLPLVLTTAVVFWLMAALFAFAAWPHVARGVRAITSVERRREYVEAARAAGAGRWRLLRHVLPAAYGFLAVEVALLVPALLAAEATVSFLGLGFPEPTASWGTMLQDAGNVEVMARAPWLLAPAAVLFLVVLALQGVRAGDVSSLPPQ